MKILKFVFVAIICGLLFTSCADPFAEGFGQDQPGIVLQGDDDDDNGTAPPPSPPPPPG